MHTTSSAHRDNGSSYVSASWRNGSTHRTCGTRSRRALSSETQGKIERWHQTLKNRILLENYYLPGELEASIEPFVDHYNHRRYHESLDNLTPADVYFGRGQTILLERERIKRKTIQNRRLHSQKESRLNIKPDAPELSLKSAPPSCLKISDDGHAPSFFRTS